jgi:isobutyryl-CoA dehydrogenase
VCCALPCLWALGAIGLSEEQAEYMRISRDFADKELLPYMQDWDANEVFPVDALRKAASLGECGEQ